MNTCQSTDLVPKNLLYVRNGDLAFRGTIAWIWNVPLKFMC